MGDTVPGAFDGRRADGLVFQHLPVRAGKGVNVEGAGAVANFTAEGRSRGEWGGEGGKKRKNDQAALQAEMISSHSGSSAGLGMQRDIEVCKLVDTTTCIGCKACEVACAEWNDLPFTPTISYIIHDSPGNIPATGDTAGTGEAWPSGRNGGRVRNFPAGETPRASRGPHPEPCARPAIPSAGREGCECRGRSRRRSLLLLDCRGLP